MREIMSSEVSVKRVPVLQVDEEWNRGVFPPVLPSPRPGIFSPVPTNAWRATVFGACCNTEGLRVWLLLAEKVGSVMSQYFSGIAIATRCSQGPATSAGECCVEFLVSPKSLAKFAEVLRTRFRDMELQEAILKCLQSQKKG